MGCAIDEFPAHLAIAPGHPGSAAVAVNVGNAGTVMRFLPAVAALTPAAVSFDGDPRARERPVGALLTALRALGADIDDGGRGALPFTVAGGGAMRGGSVDTGRVRLLAARLRAAGLAAAPRFAEGAEVRHEGPPVPSIPHIEMTVEMLRQAGAEVEAGHLAAAAAGTRPSAWRVRPGRLNLPGTSPSSLDLSNAGPFLAAALVTGGTVTIADLASRKRACRRPGRHPRRRYLHPGWARRAHLAPTELTVSGTGAIQWHRGRGPAGHPGAVPRRSPPLAALAASTGRRCSPASGTPGPRRPTGSRPSPRRSIALGGAVNGRRRPPGPGPGRCVPRPGGAWDSYDDHRMVMSAAVLGALAGARDRGPQRGHCGQDVPRLHEPMGRDAVASQGDGARLLSRHAADLDEDDIRVRAGKGSRPRTRRRPAHEAVPEGFVVTVDRGRYGCLLEDGEVLTAMKARELGRNSVVVGDRVALAGDTSGNGGEPRANRAGRGAQQRTAAVTG